MSLFNFAIFALFCIVIVAKSEKEDKIVLIFHDWSLNKTVWQEVFCEAVKEAEKRKWEECVCIDAIAGCKRFFQLT